MLHRGAVLHRANGRHGMEILRSEGQDGVDVHREEVFRRLLAEEAILKKLSPRHRARIREEDKLMDLLRRAHAERERELAEAR